MLCGKSYITFLCRVKNYSGAPTEISVPMNCREKFITLKNMYCTDIYNLLWTAMDLKSRLSKKQDLGQPLDGKKITMVNVSEPHALKSSFIVASAIKQLGGITQCVTNQDWEKVDFIEDLGRFHSLFSDAIVIQGRFHSSLCLFAKGATVPVFSADCLRFRPFHGLGALMTIQEHFGGLKNLTLTWIGPVSSMFNTYSFLLPKVGMNIKYNTAPTPDLPYSPVLLLDAKKFCIKTKTEIKEVLNPEDAVEGADIIATSEHDKANRPITLCHLEMAKKNCIFLHDLPRSKNEVTEEVFSHKNSLVWNAQENIFYCVMASLLNVLTGYQPIIDRPNFESVPDQDECRDTT